MIELHYITVNTQGKNEIIDLSGEIKTLISSSDNLL